MNTISAKKNLLFLILPFCSILFFTTCARDVQKELEHHAEKENARYPIKLDDGLTILESCAALPNKTLQYSYKVNTDKMLIDTVLIENVLKPQFIQTIKVDPGTAFFKKNDVIFQYKYVDNKGQYVCMIHISPVDYK